MMDEITYTHKGWFGLCPVYLAEPHSYEPTMEARYPYTAWLIEVSALVYGIFFKLRMDHDPMWPIKVTGKLKEPIIAEYEE